MRQIRGPRTYVTGSREISAGHSEKWADRRDKKGPCCGPEAGPVAGRQRLSVGIWSLSQFSDHLPGHKQTNGRRARPHEVRVDAVSFAKRRG